MIKQNFYSTTFGFAVISVICALLWGSAFPIVKLGYIYFDIGNGDYFSKMVFAGLRFFIGGIMVLPLSKWLCGSFKISFPKKHVKKIILIAIFGITLQYLFFFIGLGNTTGVKGSVFSTSGAFLLCIMSFLIFKDDKPTFVRILGLVLGFLGILATTLMDSGGLASDFTWDGDGFLIISGFASAITMILVKSISNKVNPVHIAFWEMVIGSLVLLAVGVIGSGGIKLDFNPASIGILLYGGVISSVAMSLSFMLLRYHTASRVESFKLLIPLFGSILSLWLLPGEVFNVYILLGLALCCAGIYLINTKSSQIKNGR